MMKKSIFFILFFATSNCVLHSWNVFQNNPDQDIVGDPFEERAADLMAAKRDKTIIVDVSEKYIILKNRKAAAMSRIKQLLPLLSPGQTRGLKAILMRLKHDKKKIRAAEQLAEILSADTLTQARDLVEIKSVGIGKVPLEQIDWLLLPQYFDSEQFLFLDQQG